MAENVYLKARQAEYEALRKSIEGLQTRAHEANRDMTADELRTVKEQGEKAKGIFAEIETLTEIETRNAKVAALAAEVQQSISDAQKQVTSDGPADKGGDVAQMRTAGGATATDRDPGHYRKGGQHSFFSDLVRSKQYSDEQATRRLVEHTRALDTTTDGPGIVPPKWLIDEFADLPRQGRAIAQAVRNIPLGSDPRPLTLPKQTAGTDSVVAEQSAENDPVDDTDAWDSDVDTVSPKATAGSQLVSRQMLDMSNPAIDQLIYADLIGAYNLKVETKVATAIMAVGTALAAAEGTGVEVTDPTHFNRVAIKAAMAVRSARKLPANLLVMSVGRYGEFIDLRDTTGRPLIPEGSDGPMNVLGVGSVNVDGRYRTLGLVATDGVATDATFAAVRASDVLLFESDMLRFRYEEQNGPESVKLGIWAYTAVLVRYGTAPVKKVTVSEES